MLHAFVSLEELCGWTVHEQFMASMSWYMNVAFSLLHLVVSAVALVFAPNWWTCWARVCGGLLCSVMPYRNEQRKPETGFHPFTKKWSVSLLPDRYVQYNLSLRFHKIPVLSEQRGLAEVLFYDLVQNREKILYLSSGMKVAADTVIIKKAVTARLALRAWHFALWRKAISITCIFNIAVLAGLFGGWFDFG